MHNGGRGIFLAAAIVTAIAAAFKRAAAVVSFSGTVQTDYNNSHAHALSVNKHVLCYLLHYCVHRVYIHMHTYVHIFIMQCPHCDNDNAISLSCLDLYYSVTLYTEKKDLKDEKKDKTSPFVLHNLDKDGTNSNGNLFLLSFLLSLFAPSSPPSLTMSYANQTKMLNIREKSVVMVSLL